MELKPIEGTTMVGPLTLIAFAIIIGGALGAMMSTRNEEKREPGIGDAPVLFDQFVISSKMAVIIFCAIVTLILSFVPAMAYRGITGHDIFVPKDAAVETISLDGAEKGPNLRTRHKWIDTKTILHRTGLPVYVTDTRGYTMGSKAATDIELYDHKAQTEGAPMSWVGADRRIHTNGRAFSGDDGGVRITDGKGNAPGPAPSSKMLDSMTVAKVKNGDALATVERLGGKGGLHLNRDDGQFNRDDGHCSLPDRINGMVPMVCGPYSDYLMKVAIKGGGYAIPVNFAGRILLADGEDMAAGKTSIRIVDPATVR